MSKLVRLYPRNPKKGWFIQIYTDVELNIKFLALRGWYEVEDDVAEKLRQVRQKKYDPRSGPAFLIADDKAHAKELEKTVLRPPEKDDESIGTTDAPIEAKRPARIGTRKASDAYDRKRPRTRRAIK